MIRVTDSISISEHLIEQRFTRSPGPGGQNVNKVETAVQLRFDAAHCPSLSPKFLRRLALLAGRRMTLRGVVIIDANRFRSQERNRRDALDRLIELLRTAAREPKRRRPTKPSRASRQRRLDDKRQRGGIKHGRAKPRHHDT